MDAITQYCPVAMGTEILGDRWTPLILREFIVGAHSFGEIQAGIPSISRSLLSARLRQLVQNGILERREEQPGRPKYWLTAAGQDLQNFVFELGEWAIRWAYFRDPTDEQLDNTHLMWRLGRGVLRDRVPARRVVIQFVLTCPNGVTDHIWLVMEPEDVDTCLKDPGYEVDLEVRTTSRELHRIWLGRTTITEAMEAGTFALEGQPSLTRAFPRWFSFSPFARAVHRFAANEANREGAAAAVPALTRG